MDDSEQFHSMYVVECADGTFYTGYSPDVEARVAAHNGGTGAKYTRSRRPVKLVAQVSFPSKHDAMSAEYHFKRLTRDQKKRFVESDDFAGLVTQMLRARRGECEHGMITDTKNTEKEDSHGIS